MEKLRIIAQQIYKQSNCSYDNMDYMYHIDMVSEILKKNKDVFLNQDDYIITLKASIFHDIIEDTNQSYNTILKICGKNVADIILNVTDVPEKNRLLKQLHTFPKTINDYRSILLKMADVGANSSYSKEKKTIYHNMYINEYQFKKYVFQTALKQYTHLLNEDKLVKFWNFLDICHTK